MDHREWVEAALENARQLYLERRADAYELNAKAQEVQNKAVRDFDAVLQRVREALGIAETFRFDPDTGEWVGPGEKTTEESKE